MRASLLPRKGVHTLAQIIASFIYLVDHGNTRQIHYLFNKALLLQSLVTPGLGSIATILGFYGTDNSTDHALFSISASARPRQRLPNLGGSTSNALAA
jgi:hypothetical protein